MHYGMVHTHGISMSTYQLYSNICTKKVFVWGTHRNKKVKQFRIELFKSLEL